MPIAAGVRLNRGAGAGWTRPSTSTNVPRATLCGWAAASDIVSTGAKQTSVRVEQRAPLVARLRLEQLGEPHLELPATRSIHLRRERLVAVEAEALQQLGVELRLESTPIEMNVPSAHS